MPNSGAGNFKGIVFDLDGVLLDSMPGHAAAWGEAFAEFGLMVEERFFYLYEGMVDRETLERLALTQGRTLEPGSLESLLELQRRIYLEKFASGSLLYPGALRLAPSLAQTGLELAVATSSTRRVLPPDLTEWLDRHFKFIVTGDLVRRGKPHPDPYLMAVQGLGLSPDQAAAVENAPAGIRSAKAAGLTVLALTTTLDQDHLAEADHIFPDHDRLADFLSTRISPPI